MKIDIYTKDGCDYCVKAKNWLDARGIKYDTHDLNDDTKRLAFYTDNNVNSVPQVFYNDKLVGGYSHLIKDNRIKIKRLMQPSKVYKPFVYPRFVEIAKVHEKLHWIEDSIPLEQDISDWKSGKLSKPEKQFIKNILVLFTQSDVAVSENYLDQFIPKFKNNEVRAMLSSFAAREFIHIRSYALLNDSLGFEEDFYNQFLEYTEMADKIEHMQDSDISTKSGLGLAIAKSVFNEGVMLFASFAMLFNFMRHNKMMGMGKVVDWSIRDEDYHASGMAELFRVYCDEHSKIVTNEFKDKIYQIARQTVALEDKFIDLAFDIDGAIEGITPQDTKNYIRFITDIRLNDLGLDSIYNIEDNPYDWIDWVAGGARHTSFFENRVSNYSVGGSVGSFKYDFVENIRKKIY